VGEKNIRHREEETNGSTHHKTETAERRDVTWEEARRRGRRFHAEKGKPKEGEARLFNQCLHKKKIGGHHTSGGRGDEQEEAVFLLWWMGNDQGNFFSKEMGRN